MSGSTAKRYCVVAQFFIKISWVLCDMPTGFSTQRATLGTFCPHMSKVSLLWGFYIEVCWLNSGEGAAFQNAWFKNKSIQTVCSGRRMHVSPVQLVSQVESVGPAECDGVTGMQSIRQVPFISPFSPFEFHPAKLAARFYLFIYNKTKIAAFFDFFKNTFLFCLKKSKNPQILPPAPPDPGSAASREGGHRWNAGESEPGGPQPSPKSQG